MIPILLYHRIAELPRELDPIGIAVPPTQFEQQMRFLARNDYHCLTLTEAVGYLRKGGHAPAKTFVLTFDDGYHDVYSTAYPILDKFGFTATVFLVADRMGYLSDWEGQDAERSGNLMTWAEARDLARKGFILGSHTLSHPRLKLMDNQSAFKEIRDSKALLEDRLEISVDFFSYPFSDSDARLQQLVKSAGYVAACGGNSGACSPFNLWRAPILRETPRSFAVKAGRWYCRQIALRESILGRFLRRCVRRSFAVFRFR